MKDKLIVRAVLVLAVTNPLVWVLFILALLLAACGLVVLLYWLVFEWARNELASPRPSSRRTHGRVPVVNIPADDDWPLLPPTPEVVAQLDEVGRVELLVLDPLAERDEQEAVPLESNADPVPPSPRPAPAARTLRKPKSKAPVPKLSPNEVEQLPHGQLVTMARRAGAVAANRRWGRDKLIAAVAGAR